MRSAADSFGTIWWDLWLRAGRVAGGVGTRVWALGGSGPRAAPGLRLYRARLAVARRAAPWGAR